MFEVEQNFNLSPEQKQRLLTDAEFQHEKTIVDTYFDTDANKFTLQDMWLRERNGKFELKVPIDMKTTSLMDQYEEIEDEQEILRRLALPTKANLRDTLTTNQFHPFCTCITVRKTYSKEGFTIVLDEVTYLESDLRFNTCEIELLVETREQMPEASSKIIAFAEKNGLTAEYLHGKVLEYLIHEKPEHYEALVQAGVVLRK
jgi:adenylate cyclase class IV